MRKTHAPPRKNTNCRVSSRSFFLTEKKTPRDCWRYTWCPERGWGRCCLSTKKSPCRGRRTGGSQECLPPRSRTRQSSALLPAQSAGWRASGLWCVLSRGQVPGTYSRFPAVPVFAAQYTTACACKSVPRTTACGCVPCACALCSPFWRTCISRSSCSSSLLVHLPRAAVARRERVVSSACGTARCGGWHGGPGCFLQCMLTRGGCQSLSPVSTSYACRSTVAYSASVRSRCCCSGVSRAGTCCRRKHSAARASRCECLVFCIKQALGRTGCH